MFIHVKAAVFNTKAAEEPTICADFLNRRHIKKINTITYRKKLALDGIDFKII